MSKNLNIHTTTRILISEYLLYYFLHTFCYLLHVFKIQAFLLTCFIFFYKYEFGSLNYISFVVLFICLRYLITKH